MVLRHLGGDVCGCRYGQQNGLVRRIRLELVYLQW